MVKKENDRGIILLKSIDKSVKKSILNIELVIANLCGADRGTIFVPNHTNFFKEGDHFEKAIKSITADALCV